MQRIECLLLTFAVLLTNSAWAQSPKVAVLDSAYTRNFFGLHYPACSPPNSYTLGSDEYQRYFLGWEYVLQTNGISYATIHDSDIENGNLLDSFKLLILSNTTSLSDSEEKNIDHWVRAGGRLIATYGSGYKDIVTDTRELDGLKKQKGGTAGLHQLWHDPLSKLFSSLAFAPGIDVRITQYDGPTAGVAGLLLDNTLPYGASANLLVSRPPSFADAYGSLVLPDYSGSAPAILVTDAAHGSVVYFSFAPEYIVSKEFGLPASMPCPDGQNWAGRSTLLRVVMRDAVLYLLNE